MGTYECMYNMITDDKIFCWVRFVEARIASHVVVIYLMRGDGLRALRRTRMGCILTLNRLAQKCHRHAHDCYFRSKIKIFWLRVFGRLIFLSVVDNCRVNNKRGDKINVKFSSAKTSKTEQLLISWTITSISLRQPFSNIYNSTGKDPITSEHLRPASIPQHLILTNHFIVYTNL